MHNRGMVGWSSNNRGMVSWSGMQNRGMVRWSGMHNRGMVSWSGMHNRGMVSWSGMYNGGMVSWSSMNDRGMVSWSSMIDRGRRISCLDWESSWSNGSSRSLLVASIAMYGLRSSMGLAHNRSMYSSMGLMDRVTNSRGIALLDTLVVSLVSGNYGQKGGTDKSLHVTIQMLRIESH